MTKKKLNMLRTDSQCTRDIYYLLRDNRQEGGLADEQDVAQAYSIWQLCQKKAEAAVVEWIAQGCREVHVIKYGEGTCYINGQAVGVLKDIKYGPL